MGTFTADLYADQAPQTVANFLAYAREGFFGGTIFHRVIKGFVIQGGGFTEPMKQKPTKPPIKLEIAKGLKHTDGTLSMARTNDPNSATGQFYVCDGAQSFLDNNYAVFGKVTHGMDVVRKIASTPTGPGDVPRTPVVVKSVKVEG
jgi:peptidyl-prolyl cis-trans isomerase A (cyclophilin A)